MAAGGIAHAASGGLVAPGAEGTEIEPQALAAGPGHRMVAQPADGPGSLSQTPARPSGREAPQRAARTAGGDELLRPGNDPGCPGRLTRPAVGPRHRLPDGRGAALSARS